MFIFKEKLELADCHLIKDKVFFKNIKDIYKIIYIWKQCMQ
jgi:hypothetical protein